MKIKPCLKAAFGASDYTTDGNAERVHRSDNPLIARLADFGACPRAKYWVLETKAETFKDIWYACPRGDWSAWLVSQMFNDVSLVPAQWFARALIHLARDGVIDESEFHWVNRMLDQIESGAPFDTDKLEGFTYGHEPSVYSCIQQFRVMQLAMGRHSGSTRYMWQAFNHYEHNDLEAFALLNGRRFLKRAATKLREIIPFEVVEKQWNTPQTSR